MGRLATARKVTSTTVISIIAADGTMDVAGLPQFHGLPAEQARSLKAVTPSAPQ